MGMKNFSFRSIGSYLQENIYHIPDYQREYSWEKDSEVDDFWNDLESAIKENRDQHFFGQIVIHNSLEEDKNYIIDGQQRTSTSVIFLSVLNRLFEDLFSNYSYPSARNRSEDIRLKYIGRWSEEENELRLHLGKSDREYFMKNIQTGSPIENKYDLKSHIRIREAYEYFMDKLVSKIELLDNIDEKYREINKYYTKFIDVFKVMYVETDDINEAFIIFETLNARGKDLETADLLKNHLFRVSGKSIDHVKNSWQDMIDNLDKIDTTKYIRHYWNSRGEFVREKDLYKRIRENVKTPKKCEELIDNLVELSEVYRALINANDETYFVDTELNSILCNLKTIKASSFYPIILSMKNMKFTEEEIRKVAKAIENLIVRNCVISGKVANKYEVIFAKIAYGIYEKEYTDIEEIIDIIKKNTISNEDFLASFNMFISKSKPVTRFILKSINNYLDKETEIINDNKKVHIEHIMPIKKGDWNISDEIHQEYLCKLGNLTLLGKEYNRIISNKVFEDKKRMYDKSSIIISKEITKYTKWGASEIEDRQNELAKIALKIW
ncbi:MAG: DUF262 domain-containing protein [Clostridium baratii]|uniref:DUF262 domain-containing protein n=1 Tax=Clostridium baratii TaxID=1561 RepID=UPI00242DF68A|nr:DUF262 domain-containing HNH endonuclease family protein [Clostridium baratii]MBS6006902.1 DUF262 domain-containing protein [Clostridium baratii]